MKNAHIQIHVHDKKVVDIGGVRRQFYSSSFAALASGHLEVFDGPLSRVRSTTRPSNITSGLLKNVGKVIAHSLLMDKIGFPFFSPAIYYYRAGEENEAVTLLNSIDICGQDAHVLSKVNSVTCTLHFLHDVTSQLCRVFQFA